MSYYVDIKSDNTGATPGPSDIVSPSKGSTYS